MPKLHLVLSRPFTYAGINELIVRVGDDRIDKLRSRLIVLAVLQQRIAPVPIRGLDIRIDCDRFAEPLAGLVKEGTAFSGVGGVVSSLKLHVAGKERRVVKLRVELQRTSVGSQRFV